MKITKKIALLVMIFILSTTFNTFAADDTTEPTTEITLTPTATSAKVGDTVTITLSAKAAAGIEGVDSVLKYDNTKLEFTNDTSLAATGFGSYSGFDGVTGDFILSVLWVSSEAAPTEATFATLTFNVLDTVAVDEVLSIKLSEIEVGDSDDEWFTVQDKEVTITVIEDTTDEGETTPGDGETTPGDGETTPGEGETTPGEGETTPGEGETTPGEGETTPGEGETTPGEGETTPGEGETTPGEGETTPGEGETTPGEGETTPGDGETTPGEGETTPGDGETTPGEGETTPGEGETTPGDGETTPGQGVGVPEDEETPKDDTIANKPINNAGLEAYGIGLIVVMLVAIALYVKCRSFKDVK